MEFIDVVNQRRTVRDFSKKSVSKAIVQKDLKAGIKAPSYNHLKKWYFVLVKDEKSRFALTQTESMVEEVTSENEKTFSDYEDLAKEMYLDAIPKQKRMIMQAPELLVVAYAPKTLVVESDRVYDLNCFASVWCCIQNILLSLAEDNVFGVTFIPKNTPAVKNVLNIPSELEIACILPFGYKADEAKVFPQKEIVLEDVLHIDRW